MLLLLLLLLRLLVVAMLRVLPPSPTGFPAPWVANFAARLGDAPRSTQIATPANWGQLFD